MLNDDNVLSSLFNTHARETLKQEGFKAYIYIIYVLCTILSCYICARSKVEVAGGLAHTNTHGPSR